MTTIDEKENEKYKKLKEKVGLFGIHHSYSSTEIKMIKATNLFNTCIGCKPTVMSYNQKCPVHGWD